MVPLKCMREQTFYVFLVIDYPDEFLLYLFLSLLEVSHICVYLLLELFVVIDPLLGFFYQLLWNAFARLN